MSTDCETLTVVGRCPSPSSRTQAHYWCKCVCGKEWAVAGSLLRRGQKSCGCLPQTYGNKLRPYESLFNWLVEHSTRYGKYAGLTYEEFLAFIEDGKCRYCGDVLMYAEHSIRARGSSVNLDRIDSSKGYCKENCVPCCWPCNRMKSVLSQADFTSQALKIAKFQERRRTLE